MSTEAASTKAASKKAKCKRSIDGCHSKGDMDCKKMNTLSEADILADTILAVLKEAQEFVADLDRKPSPSRKKEITGRISLVISAVATLKENIEEVMSLSQMSHLCSRVKSTLIAKNNHDAKLNALLGRGADKENVTPMQQLQGLLPAKKRRLNCSDPRISARMLETRLRGSQLEVVKSLPPPVNGQYYMLREAVLLLKEAPKLRKIVQELQKDKPYLLLTTYGSLLRWIKKYRKDGVLPPAYASGIEMGRPRYVSTDCIPVLNENVGNIKDKVESQNQLETRLVQLRNEKFESQGLGASEKPPDKSTVSYYNFMAASEPGVSLTKSTSTVDRNRARITATTSERSCMSHICSMAYVLLEPGLAQLPDSASEGARRLLEEVKQAVGCDMKPIEPFRHANIDMTGYYTWAGAGK